MGAAARDSTDSPIFLDQGYGGALECSSSRRHRTFAPAAFSDFFQPLIFCVKYLSISISFTEFCPYLITWWRRFLPLAIPQAKGPSTCILSFTDFSFHSCLKFSRPSFSQEVSCISFWLYRTYLYLIGTIPAQNIL